MRLQVNIHVSDQAKSLKSSEFIQVLTQSCKHLFPSNSAIFKDFVE